MVTDDRGVLGAFETLTNTLLAGAGTDDVLDRLVDLAVDAIEPCEHASISYSERKAGSVEDSDGRVFTIAATGPKVLELDELQYRTGQGPCVTAATQRKKDPDRVIKVSDTSADTLWPEFSHGANSAGIGSISSFTMRTDGTVGALNLYAAKPHAFSDGDDAVGMLFAAYSGALVAVTDALNQERRVTAQLHEALDTRDVIGRAKGMLMERERIGNEQAFEVLKRLSQQLNVKLRDIAREIADQ